MLTKFKASVLTIVLMAWSTLVLAQTAPTGSPAPGTASPTGTTTGADPAATGEGLNWIWIALVVVVAAALLYYFLGRRRGTRM